MKRGRTVYSAADKAAALAEVAAGRPASDVARDYGIPEGTLRAWRHREEPLNPALAIAKREQVGELLLGYLEANLAGLRAQVKVFADPAWLALQNAHDAAILHGVMTDKAIRLLEAMRPRGRPDGVDDS